MQHILQPRTLNHQGKPGANLPRPKIGEDLFVPSDLGLTPRFSADVGGKVYEYDGVVERVIDGDSLWCVLSDSRDFGFDQIVTIDKRADLRLFGLDAWPKETVEGKNGLQLVINATLRGKLRVQTIKDKREKYGRYLAVLWVGNDEKSVNQQLIEAGLALPWNGKGPHPTT